MSDTNGASVENRLPKSSGRKVKAKGTLSQFQKWFDLAGSREGAKPQAVLSRKTEEGALRVTIKGFPASLTADDALALAEEVGISITIKSETGIGGMEVNLSKRFADENASGFLEDVFAANAKIDGNAE